MLVLIIVKKFSKNGRTEAKNFHVYKDKQNVKVDIDTNEVVKKKHCWSYVNWFTRSF